MTEFGAIRIEGSTDVLNSIKLFVDDTEITNLVKDITIRMAVDCITTVDITLFGDVEIPDGIEGYIAIEQDSE